jgi:HlyD family secretion protein
VALAAAQLAKDRTNLGYSVIRSPVTGVVVSREVDVGQTVAASLQTPTLFKIAQDLAKMQIDSSYAEADVGNIRVGQQVTFRVDAFPNRVFGGSVRQVRLNPTTQQNVVTYDVVISVDNPDLVLMPGMTAYVNILVAQRKDALLVPNAALRFHPVDATARGAKAAEARKDAAGRNEGAGGTVYLIDNGQPKAVRIVLGITDNRVTEVLRGPLKAGDTVIVEDRQPPAKPGAPGMRLF